MEKTTLTKNQKGYGYKYTDIAEIHRYLESHNMSYYQEIETNEQTGSDYIMTYRCINGSWEDKPKRGCKVVDATLQGVKNPAQEQGSALTYARRYSLLMAFGLATEDDDAQALSKKINKTTTKKAVESSPNYKQMLLDELKKQSMNVNEYAKAHNLNAKTTQVQAKALLENLKAGASNE